MTDFTIYTAIIGYNKQIAKGAYDITTIKPDPTPIEALLRPTQELYDAYKRYSLTAELRKQTISEKQRKDMVYLLSILPKDTVPMSLYDFVNAYTALIRDRVGADLSLFKSIFENETVALACTCKPGIRHFCHKFVVQEILGTSAVKFGRRVIYGGELDENGQRFIPDRHAEPTVRRSYVSGVTPYYDPKYFDTDHGAIVQPEVPIGGSGSLW